MATDLSGVTLKIERAEAHLAELKDSIETTLDSSTEHFTVEFDPQSGHHVYRAHGLPEIDPQWSLLVGEILYQLRSALDHLAWQLVLLDGGEPGQQTQFPVLTKPPTGKKGKPREVQLKPAVKDAKILDALDKAQPYRGHEGNIVPFRNSPLWLLHRLNIIDKHRLLLVVVCMLDIDRMYWGGDADTPQPKLKVSVGPVDEGSEVAWFDWGDNAAAPGLRSPPIPLDSPDRRPPDRDAPHPDPARRCPRQHVPLGPLRHLRADLPRAFSGVAGRSPRTAYSDSRHASPSSTSAPSVPTTVHDANSTQATPIKTFRRVSLSRIPPTIRRRTRWWQGASPGRPQPPPPVIIPPVKG